MKKWIAGVAVALAFGCSTAFAQGTVGEVEFAHGVGAAQRPGASARVLGQGTALEQGDTLTTGVGSFAVIKLKDGTKMTLRPNTAMSLAELSFDEPGKPDNLVANLFKGGLRVVTGLISKRGVARLVTTTATVGIRGTDFDARICAADCAADAGRLAQRGETTVRGVVPASARVAAIQGELTAVGENGERRLVAAGGPAFKGDVLETGARGHAVLVFRDDTRVTVQAGTRVKIDEYLFDARAPAEGRFAFNLLKGGIRAVTGLIAKARPGSVRFTTPTATVGIRGTGIDMECSGACAGDPVQDAEQGFRIVTWQGEVEVFEGTNEINGLVVSLGQTAFQSGPLVRPVLVRDIPPAMRDNPFPRPDMIDTDAEKLFSGVPHNPSEPGLYVLVRDGHINLGDRVDVARGEAAFASPDGGRIIRLNDLPVFLLRDPTPRPDRVDERNMRSYDLLGLGFSLRAANACRP